MARQNPDEEKTARAAEAEGAPSSGVSRAAQGAPPEAPRRGKDEIRESVQQWKRVFRSLQRQQETDPVRKWLRARSLDIAIRAVAPSDAGDSAEGLTTLGEQVTDLLEDLEPTIDAGVRREVDTWIDLRRERDALDRRLHEAWSELHKTFEERSRRRVREWFAQDLPVAVLVGEPVPAVTSEADALALLPKAEEAATLAHAVCPPKPQRDTQEVLTDWPWNPAAMQPEERPLDPATIDRQANEARRALAILPPAGRQPMWSLARDIPVVYMWLERAWYLTAFVTPIVTLVALSGLVMHEHAAEDPGFWRPMYAGAALAWAVVSGGWITKRLIDSFLTNKLVAWVSRSAPIDKAHRAVGWQYLLRRAAAEQRDAEVRALRDLVSASARLRHFDSDPDLGGQLALVQGRHPDLAAYVDAAAADLR